MLAVCGAVPGAFGPTGGGQRQRGLQPAEQQVGHLGSHQMLAPQGITREAVVAGFDSKLWSWYQAVAEFSATQFSVVVINA